MSRHRRKQSGFTVRVVNILRVLMLFLCLGLFWGGLGRLLRPDKGVALDLVMLVLGACLAFLTIDQWVQVLPGVFGVAGLNAVGTLYSGHLVNQPSVPTPKSVALVFMATFLTTAVILKQLSILRPSPVEQWLFFAQFLFLGVAAMSNSMTIPSAAGVLLCVGLLLRVRKVRPRRPAIRKDLNPTF